MIKLGCASVHPEDVSFLFSGPTAELLRSKNFIIEPEPLALGKPSGDVLFVDANKMNKLTSMIDLSTWTWVMLSSNKEDAWEAWRLGAAYFLLRPFSNIDLAHALERVEQCYYWRKQLPPPHFQDHKLDLQLIKGRRVSVRFGDILFLEARGELTCVHLNLPGQEKLIAIRNLGFWEQQLTGQSFLRIHKKYLVNVTHVSTLLPDTLAVRHFSLPIAKRRRKEVEKTVFSHQLLPEIP